MKVLCCIPHQYQWPRPHVHQCVGLLSFIVDLAEVGLSQTACLRKSGDGSGWDMTIYCVSNTVCCL